jgi:hypothetical protein
VEQENSSGALAKVRALELQTKSMDEKRESRPPLKEAGIEEVG